MKNKVEFLNQVEEFQKLMSQPVLKTPQIPVKQRSQFRISLIQEELDELKESIEKNDIVGVLDALCDIQYVLSGSVLEFGMQDIFLDAFNEVHRSNMSKACSSLEIAAMTVYFYENEKNTEAYIVERDSKFFVLRKSDNKQLKSIEYSEADLKQFLSAKIS